MEVYAHDRWGVPLPPGHKFPISKYRLLRERVEGLVEVRESAAVPWDWLAAVHDDDLLDRIRSGSMTVREQRGLGLPWSEMLVERGRRSVGGTLAAARRALRHGVGMNLGGGTHHAGRDFARGYCLFNDVAVAVARLRAEGLVRRVLVVDCDVHQGDGTAQILGPGRRRLHALAARRAQLPIRADPLRPGRRSAVGHRRRRVPARAVRRAGRRRRRTGHRVLPRRRRPVGGRPPRPARPDQGRPAGARRARARAAARDPDHRRARRRLRARRQRHRRHQRGDRRGRPRRKLKGLPGA